MKTKTIEGFYQRGCRTSILAAGLLFLSSLSFGIDGVSEKPLFSTNWGEADVELFVEGSWKASLYGGGGYSFAPLSSPSSFPGLTSGFAFAQTPDVTLSLLLDKRLFFDVSVLGGWNENAYAAGYQGKEDEFLQNLTLGNMALSLSDFMGVDQTVGTSRTPSLFSRMISGPLTSELLLRYNPLAEQTEYFRGMNRLEYIEWLLDDYRETAAFILPDAEVSAPVFYLQDPEGDISATDNAETQLSFRKMTASEFQYEASSGIVHLTEKPEGIVAVSYPEGGAAVGSSGGGVGFLPALVDGIPQTDQAGIDFDWSTAYPLDLEEYRLEITDAEGTVTGLLLSRPGARTPFEMANAYAYTGEALDGNVELQLVDRMGTNSSVNIQAVSSSSGNALLLSRVSGPRELLNRYPFLDLSPEVYRMPQSANSTNRYSLRLLREEPVEELQLSELPVEESLSIYRSGIPERDFSVDYTTGVITLGTPPQATEEISITYRTSQTTATEGDLQFLSGNRFQLSENHLLDLSAELLWNISDQTYTLPGTSRPGSAGLRLGYRGSFESASWEIGINGGFSSADTTGTRRLESMDQRPLTPGLRSSGIGPSAAPGSLTLGGILYGLFPSNRGNQPYTDFSLKEASGAYSYLAWDSTNAESYAFADGNPAGPSIAGGGTAVDGYIMVMPYQLNSGEWAGAQIPLGSTFEDLSLLRFLEFPLKTGSLPEGTEIILQLGSLSEDLDGDFRLDTESTYNDEGFAFNLQGEVFRIGGTGLEAASIDSEDRNGNGILDSENPLGRWSVQIDGKDLTKWQTIRIYPSEEDKRLLSRVTGIRLLVVATDQPATGNLYVGAPDFHIDTLQTSRGEDRLEYTTETTLPSDRLPSAFLAETCSFLEDESNRVLVWEWEGRNSSSNIQGLFSNVDPNQYRYLDLHFYYPELGGNDENFSLTLLSGENSLLQAEGSVVGGNTWHRLTFDLIEGTATLDETPLSMPHFETGNTINGWKWESEGNPSGCLILDELLLRESLIDTEVSGSIALQWTPTEARWQAGNFPLIGLDSIEFSAEGSYSIEGESTPEAEWAAKAQCSGVVLGTGIETYLRGSETDPATWATGHLLTLPETASFFTLSQQFDYQPESAALSRSEIKFDLAPFSSQTSVELQREEEKETVLWQTRFDWSEPEWNHFSLLAAAENRRSETNPSRGYFEEWISAFTGYLPDFSVANDRRLNGEINGLWIGPNFQPEGRLAVDTEVQYASNTARTSALDWNIKLPATFLLTDGDLKIELLLSDSLEEETTEETASDWLTDADAFLDFTERYQSSWLNWPLSSFWIPLKERLPQTGNREEAESSATLNMTRPFLSRWTDLFLPSGIEAQLVRHSLYNGAETEDALLLSVTSLQKAVNLWGRTGAYAFFDFYSVDEWSTSVTADIDLYSQSWSWNLGFSGRLNDPFLDPVLAEEYEFTGHRPALQLDQLFTLGETASFSRTALTLVWNTPWQQPFYWIGSPVEGEIYLSHSEEITLGFPFGSGSASPQIDLKHSSRFIAGDMLEIRAWLKFGWLYSLGVHQVGAEGGVEGTLFF